MWPKCFHVGSCALFILVGWLLANVFGGVCATPINMSIKGPEKPTPQPLTENPAALSLKLIKGQNNITDPKNTLSFRSRMCTQRIRSLIIYCAVNLDLPKETDGLGPTLQQQQVSRIHVGRRFGTISKEVLEPVPSMRYSHWGGVRVCAGAKRLTRTDTHTDLNCR